jgi:DNA-binding CsgD family transcriptional regulator
MPSRRALRIHPREPEDRERTRPVASLEDAARELSVQRALLRSIVAWDGFARGSERLLRELADALGQIAGALWLPHGHFLTARSVWAMPSVNRRALTRVLGEQRLCPGVGLAGLAWRRGVALEIGRSPLAKGRPGRERLPHGLTAMVAIPCSDGEEVLGVLELYSIVQTEPSEHLMRVLTSAGRDLGLFFSRRRGQLGPSPLTAREEEVLALAGEGLSVREIGARLVISPATAKTHLEHIYKRLGVRHRTEAVAHALRAGFIE